MYRSLVLMLTLSLAAGADEKLLGFSESNASAQRKLESNFDASLEKDNLRTWMQQMTVRPHHVGAPQTKANAEFIAPGDWIRRSRSFMSCSQRPEHANSN